MEFNEHHSLKDHDRFWPKCSCLALGLLFKYKFHSYASCISLNLPPPCISNNLYAQSHNRVDNIVVVLLQCLDSLVAGDAGLGHDQLDVLVLKTSSINLLLIFFLLLLGISLDSLALVLVGVVVASVVVTGVVVSLRGSELLSGGSLGLGVEVLDLSLTENAANLSVDVIWMDFEE
jgi:hypothetical protein